MSEILRADSTNYLEVPVEDPVTGEPVEDAAVAITELQTPAGENVAGVTLPIALAHVAAGIYRGLLPVVAALTPGQKVFAGYTVTQGAHSLYGREQLNVRRFS